MRKLLIGSALVISGLFSGGAAMATETCSAGSAVADVSSQSTVGQTLTTAQVYEVINALKEELPQELAPGITWTEVTLTDNDTYFQLTIQMSPEAYEGISSSDMRNAFASMSKSEIQEYLGEEFMSIAEVLGKKTSIRIVIPGESPLVMRVN